MTDSQLLPCPFCGGDARMNKTWSPDYNGRGKAFYWVTCKRSTCEGKGGHRSSKSMAASKWNTRHTKPPAPLDVEALYRSTCNCEGDVAPCTKCAEDSGWNDCLDFLHRTNRLNTTPHKENDDG